MQSEECPFTPFPTGCWIRGKVFNKCVHECCGKSLYEDKTRTKLNFILQSLKEQNKQSYPEKEKITNADTHAHLRQLIEYHETLLSIKEWDGKLIAWY